VKLPFPERPFWSHARVAALVAAEVFALEQGILLLGTGRRAARFVRSNNVTLRAGLELLLPLLALVAFAVVVWLAPRRPAWFASVRKGAVLASPVFVLWALPGLLQPNAFDKQPLVLMLFAAIALLGLEATLFVPLREAPRVVTLAARRARVWDVGAGVCILSYAAWATFASVRLHEKGLTSIYDLALFEHLLFGTLHGEHGMALGAQYFGVHTEPILYAVLPLYALVPRTETLLAVQSFLLAGTAVPLYLLGRRWLGPTVTAFSVVVAYLAHPAVHGPNFYDFHFLTLSPFFVAWAAYFFFTRSNKLLALSVFGAMLCREDVALGLGLVASGLVALRVRPKAAAVVALTSFTWFVVVKFWWMERFNVDSFSSYYAPLIRKGDEGFTGVLRTLVTNPLYAVSTFLTPEKLLLALQLLVPFAALPVRQWKTLPLLLPGLVVVGLAASDASIVRVQFHYSCHFLPYLAIASLVALAVRRPSERLRSVLGLALGTLIVTAHFGAFFRPTFSTAFHQVSFGWTAEDEQRRDAWRRIASRISDDAAVSAGEHEGPHLARRIELYALKDTVNDARFVVFSRSSLNWGGGEHVQRALRSDRFGIVAIEGPFVLLERGKGRTGDAAVDELREGKWL
jgi:uncharacterized membrane protein